jgi:polynucleotide 5'-hydroxyl-kinase GRC3/NOL9
MEQYMDLVKDRRVLLKTIWSLPSPAVIYFLGESDTGKTTLVTWLANRLLNGSVAILDADIGQSGVLPLTLSLLKVDTPFVTLSQLSVVEQEFIPGYNLLRYVERNAKMMGVLTEHARAWAQYCLVDTTGFVSGPGARLKRREIEETRPDLVVALQREGNLNAPVLSRIHCPSIRFKVLFSVGRKSTRERTELRTQRFLRYFRRSRLLEVPAADVIGIPEQHEDKIVGLYGDSFLGLGVVVCLDEEKFQILTPVKKIIKKVEFSTVRFPLGHTR